ncbi:MAG: transglutaminase family protein [Blautia sp.]
MIHKHSFCLLYSLLFFSLLLTACSSNTPSSGSSRPNDPALHIPKADGTAVIGQEPLIIDVSHTDQGYVMARYLGNAEKANVQIIGSDKIEYQYFLTSEDDYVPLPLTSGNGTYMIKAYENLSGNQYVSLYSESLEVSLENDYIPYLYPNQYVFFTADSQIVTAARDIVKDSASDLNAVSDIYHYVTEQITYDKEKAQTVEKGYLPDVDQTLATGKGICFDYAALMTSMLRAQSIPTKLQIGYAGKVYHAWISVYIKDVGWIDDIIQFDGENWERMDPTFAAGNQNKKKIQDYIGNGDNYITRFTR